MILGLIAGSWIQKGINWSTLGLLTFMGIVCLTMGYGLDRFGICPNVKKIWTPTWVLFSGGWCFLILAFFAFTTDFIGRPGWSYPLRVIGANSIVAYVGSHLIEGFVIGSFKTHLGADIFKTFGDKYESFVAGVVVLIVYWLILWAMYRAKMFVRI